MREPIKHIKRASYVFLTKSNGQRDVELEELIKRHNPNADIIECAHKPQYLKRFGPLGTEEKQPLDFLKGKRVGTFSGIAVPESFEKFVRDLGGSIESQRALFVDQNLAKGWLGQSVRKEDKKPTHDQMLEYYKKHAAEWDTPARARWEQLTAKWSNFNSRQEAVAALARWGDEVMVKKSPFAEVAKAHSQEFAADEGGRHDWVTKGSLLSAAIDEALFSLPVGAMSRIIEDADGCHIIRVVEREESKRAPFIDVQPEIQKALHEGGEAEREREYIEKLRKDTPVWTVFDEAEQQAIVR